jgi:ABC-2 type transport system permease protein
VLNDGRTAAIASLGLLIVMYFMETIGQSVEKLEIIRSFSLFHYAGLPCKLFNSLYAFRFWLGVKN